ncbi:hypothetical protein QE374_001764 [Microbacterium sp. SORGH_AS428]|uniref:hypothetical protein n=1 Tax=Microbacterium sp. SORGH_AS_0428 TaxID=3041788 RepID=UPI00285B0DE0|nr:hypothetical protein [Microbacterium sp. SORGH_AS_0428]MDR6199855.1 hypothetical protein [Microbacterium sp. SORGH_AS_0428]
MDESVNGSSRRAGRILLLAAGVGLLWAGVSVLTFTTSAHADDDDRGGLIGLVGGVTGAASDLVGATTGAVGDILPPVAPVTDAASQTVSTVTTTVSDTVAYVPEVVPELQPVVEPVVTEIVQPVVTDVVQPIIDGVGALVEPVPVVSDVVGAIDLPTVIGAVPGVVGSVDDTVGSVIGTPGHPTSGGVVPSVPLPGTDSVAPPSTNPLTTQDAATAALVAALTATADARHATVAGAGGAAFVTPSAAAPVSSLDLRGAPPLPGHSAPWESSAPSGSSSSGSSSGSLSFTLGWVESSAWPASAGSAIAPRDGDDDLPSSPVFDTDISPD